VPKLSHAILSYRRCQRGAITALNVFFLMIVAIFAGIAIDMASAISARTQLQATADAAAHAALVHREWHEPEEAKARAIAIATGNMPSEAFGNVLAPEDIVFGDFDRVAKTFTPDETSRNAVLVKTERIAAKENPVGTFLLQFIGLWNWDLRTVALFETYYPTCLMEGFVAEDVVDIQSNNSYFNGFCIHSNNYVTINNNNFFEPGTIVSMPDSDDLVVAITGNGEDKNDGLQEALREGRWFIKILNRIDRIREGVLTEGHRYAQAFTTNFDIVSIDQDLPHLRQGNKYVIEPADLDAGRVYTLDCNKVDLKSGTYGGLVLVANCPVEMSNGVILEDTVLVTTYSGSKAVYSPANIVLGKKDFCAPGGGAKVVTKGSVDFSAGVELYGSQIIAGGNVEFSSNADGMQGASIVAGGRIDSTSNMNFAFCGSGVDHFFAADYFRLAG
jgi:hypothetical protein